eukprot:TRINITY_DN14453_c0_g1_i6.p1 TRINITY_DN14453_c0_g1~~TRINITY_DN14453_c0_g1_i6.p1  ORF type:complete len:310 (-),score=30.40 TRINITY_DN14453_c0_g1_i6:297-1175(-)
MAPRHHESELSTTHHAIIGALTGSIEQAIMRPTVYWKAELQQQRFCLARAVNPLYCYRGLPVAVLSIAPITCIQFAATNFALKSFGCAGKGYASDKQTMFASIFAGAGSAIVQSPCQLVEINQQKHGGTIHDMVKRVLKERGLLTFWRGGSMTAIREGIFCASFIAIAPLIRRQLDTSCPGMLPGTSAAVSSVISGAVGGAISHPADTLKTRLQGGVFAGAVGSPVRPRDAWMELKNSGGLIGKLYAGYVPRAFRLSCCTFIYGFLTERLEGLARQIRRVDGNLFGNYVGTL